MKEICCQLTGDASALSSNNEEEVDECVCQALDLEDAEVVVDLRHHNKSHTGKYEPFGEVCEQCIESNIELADDDRQYDCIAHLANALSVNDLVSEVSKTVGPNVPIPSPQWL